LAGNDFRDRFKAMLPVSGIDAFGRVPDGEILSAAQTGGVLQYRRAVLLDSAGIYGRFKDNDVAAFKKTADRFRCAEERTEIGTTQSIDRSRHGDDVEIRLRQCFRFVGVDKSRLRQLGLFDFKGAVETRTQLLDTISINVESDDGGAGSGKGDGHR